MIHLVIHIYMCLILIPENLNAWLSVCEKNERTPSSSSMFFLHTCSARTEWVAQRRRLKEQTTALEEAEQKAKDDLLRAMSNSSQVWRCDCRCFSYVVVLQQYR